MVSRFGLERRAPPGKTNDFCTLGGPRLGGIGRLDGE